MFYSSFSFHFSQYVDIDLISATLRDTLSVRARSLITRIGFMIMLRCAPGSSNRSYEEKWRQALEAVVELLPDVRQVELTWALIGPKVPDYQGKEVVARAVRIVSPLIGIASLVVRGDSNKGAQRMRIVREVREAFGCQ